MNELYREKSMGKQKVTLTVKVSVTS